MKKTLWLLLAATSVLHSCSVDRLFSIGVRLPSPHSRYAKAKYNSVSAPFDVIVVPGFPYQPDEVATILKLRIHWARYLYNAGLTHHIIFSGSAVYSPYVESIAMKIIADSLGLPPDHTFTETKAEHSIENVFYSMRMAQSMGFRRIAVATDPYQARMLEPLIRKFCPDIEVVPMVYSKIKSDQDDIPSIVDTDAFVNNFVSLRERETRVERHSGTRGRRVASEIEVERLHKLFMESGQPEFHPQSDSSTHAPIQ